MLSRARVAVALIGASAMCPASATASLAPGIYVNGPTGVAFNTPYRYEVTVLTNRSYKRAAVGLVTLGCSHKLFINLTAHHPWRHSFPMIFSTDSFQQLPAVLAALVSPASQTPPYARTLFHVRLALTALPEAVPTAEPAPYSYSFCDEVKGN
jgi:hypothetical protein